LNLTLYQKIGPFDEKLFIDYVDNDYCYRAKLAGYKLLKFTNVTLIHQLGKMVNASSYKSLYLLKKKKVVHPPIRCYYMYRNMLYLVEKYTNLDKEIADWIRINVTKNVKISMLYGGQTSKTLRYIKLAKEDYKNKRFGKLQQPI
jgi:rhamnosyltransferase